MAKIDLEQILTTGEGEPIPIAPPTAEAPHPEPLTLKIVCLQALLTSQEGDAEVPTMGYRLYTLAHGVQKGGERDLTADDVALLKTRIARMYSPWVVGRSWDMLEGREEPSDVELKLHTTAAAPAPQAGRRRLGAPG